MLCHGQELHGPLPWGGGGGGKNMGVNIKHTNKSQAPYSTGPRGRPTRTSTRTRTVPDSTTRAGPVLPYQRLPGPYEYRTVLVLVRVLASYTRRHGTVRYRTPPGTVRLHLLDCPTFCNEPSKVQSGTYWALGGATVRAVLLVQYEYCKTD